MGSPEVLHRTKRQSDGDPSPHAKRHRNHFGHGNAVDQLPVRTREGGISDVKSANEAETNSSRRRHPASPPSRTISFATTSFASTSRESAVSGDFSEVSDSQETNITNPLSDESDTGDPYAPDAQEHEALERSFSAHEMQKEHTTWRQNHVRSLSDSVIRPSSEPVFINLVDDDEDSDTPVPWHAARTTALHRSKRPDFSENRLSEAWPRFRTPGLNNAPLAVIWEVLRAALHCGVNLSTANFCYDHSSNWHEQSKLRMIIRRNPAFAGKTLPPPSSTEAWGAAMKDFHSGDRCVSFSATFSSRGSNSSMAFGFNLEPLRLELSHRLIRRFGPDRFLCINVPSSALKHDDPNTEETVRWLTEEPLYLLGRLWKPFFIKQVDKMDKRSEPTSLMDMDSPKKMSKKTFFQRIYLFAVDGDSFRPLEGLFPPQEEAESSQERSKLGLPGLLQWALQIREPLNSAQQFSKLFSRISLSLSRTHPTVVLEKHQIRHRSMDLGSHKVMNDGIGLMSRSFAVEVAARLHLPYTPSAYQGRIGSAKGMWIIDGNHNDEDELWIETYPSQRKWYCDFQDVQHRTFEARSWPRPLKPADLNGQLIPILEACSTNPVAMRRAIADKLQDSLQKEIESLEAAFGDPLALRLWIQQSGISDDRRIERGYVPFTGGLPDSREDTIAYLLDHGFDPRQSKFLKKLGWEMVERITSDIKTRMNIQVPCSTYAFMAADFTGTLEEDEVHFSFSNKFDAPNFADTGLEEMDILIARLPAHLPTDIRKVRAVHRKELRHLKDVIVFPTKGESPLADILSGGDYDGDIAWVCFDQLMVSLFRNASVTPDRGPELLEQGYIRKSKLTFEQIASGSDAFGSTCNKFIHKALCFSLERDLLGPLTMYKEKLCYHQNCIDSDAAINMSTLLSSLVDRAKQGISFNWDDWHRFRKDRIKAGAGFDEPEYTKERASTALGRRQTLHIRDYLKFKVANVTIEKACTHLWGMLKVQSSTNVDPDLTKLYREAADKCSSLPGFKRLLDHLREGIEGCRANWSLTMRPGQDSGFDTSFLDKAGNVYQAYTDIGAPDDVQETSAVKQWLEGGDFADDPDFNRLALLRASLTFNMYHTREIVKFAWRMAGRQLCFLKAREVIRRRPKDAAAAVMTPVMYATLKPNKKFVEAVLARQDAGEASSAMALDEATDFDENGTVLDDC